VKLKWGMEYKGPGRQRRTFSSAADRLCTNDADSHTHTRVYVRRPLSCLVSSPGFLVSVDSYMNLQLASSEEWIGGKFAGNLGEVLIRCNNVLYIRAAQEEEGMEQDAQAKDVTMGV
jgi:hypothetical protein